MTKATSVRLDEELLNFIRNDLEVSNTSDGIRGVLLWVKQYQGSYLTSVRDYIRDCITHNPEGSAQKS